MLLIDHFLRFNCPLLILTFIIENSLSLVINYYFTKLHSHTYYSIHYYFSHMKAYLELIEKYFCQSYNINIIIPIS